MWVVVLDGLNTILQLLLLLFFVRSVTCLKNSTSCHIGRSPTCLRRVVFQTRSTRTFTDVAFEFHQLIPVRAEGSLT
eukprot:m.82858 g.82858  ORF g.82858 m.82858 type:complete len:77 (+) comp11148_c0_seq1:952-1182(+)